MDSQTAKQTERHMEKPDEQCTVVFALIVTEPASMCVCLCVGGGGLLHPPLPLAGSVTSHAKTTVQFSPDSSMEKQKDKEKTDR